MSEQSESLVFTARAGFVIAIGLSMGLLLTACGQKGALTLTSAAKPPSAATPTRAAVTPATPPVASPASAPPPRTWGSPPP